MEVLVGKIVIPPFPFAVVADGSVGVISRLDSNNKRINRLVILTLTK